MREKLIKFSEVKKSAVNSLRAVDNFTSTFHCRWQKESNLARLKS